MRGRHELPFTNKRLLVKTQDGFKRDDFVHEHFLVVKQEGKAILLSGCAHNGILSILDAYVEKYGKAPDLVVSGFHLMKKNVTCHCTGTTAFDVMKNILGEQLEYVHSGEEVTEI